MRGVALGARGLEQLLRADGRGRRDLPHRGVEAAAGLGVGARAGAEGGDRGAGTAADEDGAGSSLVSCEAETDAAGGSEAPLSEDSSLN